MNEKLFVLYFTDRGTVTKTDGPFATYGDAVTIARDTMPDEEYTVAEIGYFTDDNHGNLRRQGWHCLGIFA
jgi:hypothetical protein